MCGVNKRIKGGFSRLTEEVEAMLVPFASKDETRTALVSVYFNPVTGEAVASDGNRLAVMLGKANPDAGGDGVPFPYGSVIPGYVAGGMPEFRPDEMIGCPVDAGDFLASLDGLMDDVDHGTLWMTRDGRLKASARRERPMPEHDDGGYFIGYFSLLRLSEAFRFLMKAGSCAAIAGVLSVARRWPAGSGSATKRWRREEMGRKKEVLEKIRIGIHEDGGLCLREVYCGVRLQTAEGNEIGICMRDDTFEINVMPGGEHTGNWWAVDMATGTIKRLGSDASPGNSQPVDGTVARDSAEGSGAA